MDLANHFQIIWRKRRIVLAAAVAAAVIMLVWRATQPTEYVAETSVQVIAAPSGQDSRPTPEEAVFVAQGYAERAGTTAVLNEAGRRSRLALDASAVRDRVSVTADPDAATITVTAEGPSAADAADLSDAVAASLVSAVERDRDQLAEAALAPLRSELADLAAALAALAADDPSRSAIQARHDALVAATVEQQVDVADSLRVLSPADRDLDPIGPRPVRDGLLAFLVAAILAAELVVAVTARNDRFSGTQLRDDVASASGLPVLATVGQGPPAARREAIRELRTNLALMTPSFDAPSTIALVGVDAGVGCTETAIELSRTAAAGSRPVLLVDGDMRRPAIHDRLGIARSPGLSDVLGGADLSPDLLPKAGVTTTPLYVLAAGHPIDDPVMALSEHLRDRVLEPAARRVGLTVVDTPSIMATADAAAIAAQCDTTVLVIDARTTSRRAVREVVSRLRQVGVIPLGIVVNTTSRQAWPQADQTSADPESEAALFDHVVQPMPVGDELPPPVTVRGLLGGPSGGRPGEPDYR